jgi:hypothetical protein
MAAISAYGPLANGARRASRRRRGCAPPNGKLHSRIESIRLHNGIKAVTLRSNHLFYQSRSLQYVVQARKGFLFPDVMENVATAKIFGIIELDRCAGRGVTR